MWVDALNPVREIYRAPLVPGSDVEVWHIPVILDDWVRPPGSPPLTWHETYGKTQITGDDGNRSVAEIEIARRLSARGYQAYLVDAFGANPVEAWKSLIIELHEMPSWLQELCRRIRRRMSITKGGETAGMPDVAAWLPDQGNPIFIEYKGLKDKPRAAQEEWMRADLLEDIVSETSIAVVQRVKR